MPEEGRRRAYLLVLVAAVTTAAACSTGPDTQSPESWTEPRTGITFLRVEPGTFTMGSPLDEPRREAQEQQHQVRLTRAFWLGATEVTQRQWRDVMGANPSWFEGRGDSRPVENVTGYEVHAFIDRLNEQNSGYRFRLPTEAEWEYACRAGTQSPYSTGAVLTHADANFAASPERAAAGDGEPVSVGSFPANAWGFHDMHGNVWEWTEDDHCPYSEGSVVDPRAACSAPLKVIRGGSWYFGSDSARCALRYTHWPQDRGFSLGFRIARD